MKTVLLKLAAAALAVVTLNAVAANPAPAAPSDTSALPKVFTDVGVTMQSRVCGELMTTLALGGVQSMQMRFTGGKVPVDQRKPVYETGAQAVILLAMSGSLNLDDRLKAGEIAAAIEKMDPAVHVDTAKACQRRVAAWIKAGEVKRDLIDKAYAQARQLMDKDFDMADSPGQ